MSLRARTRALLAGTVAAAVAGVPLTKIDYARVAVFCLRRS